jgi:hypothetical protein
MGLLSWLFGSSSSGGGGAGGQDLHAQKMEYFRAALEKAEAGERFHDLLRKSNRKQLKDLYQSDVTEEVEILTSCCEICDAAFEERTFDINELLAYGGPIPHPDCKCKIDQYEEGWCACEYVLAP